MLLKAVMLFDTRFVNIPLLKLERVVSEKRGLVTSYVMDEKCMARVFERGDGVDYLKLTCYRIFKIHCKIEIPLVYRFLIYRKQLLERIDLQR